MKDRIYVSRNVLFSDEEKVKTSHLREQKGTFLRTQCSLKNNNDVFHKLVSIKAARKF